MTSNHRHVMRVLLALLCAGALGLTAAVLWVMYNHPFAVLIFGRPRLTPRRRKVLLRILRPFETLVARAFNLSPAISPPKSRAVRGRAMHW
jgi:hypothetical protein